MSGPRFVRFASFGSADQEEGEPLHPHEDEPLQVSYHSAVEQTVSANRLPASYAPPQYDNVDGGGGYGEVEVVGGGGDEKGIGLGVVVATGVGPRFAEDAEVEGHHLDGVDEAQYQIRGPLALGIGAMGHNGESALLDAAFCPLGHGHLLGIADGRFGGATGAKGVDHIARIAQQ